MVFRMQLYILGKSSSSKLVHNNFTLVSLLFGIWYKIGAESLILAQVLL